MSKPKKTKRKKGNCYKDKIDRSEISAIAIKKWNDQLTERLKRNKQREDKIKKRAVALFEIMDIGPKALGNRDKLLWWLTTPNRALGDKIPLTLMIADKAEFVRDELLRIERGIFA